MKTVMPAKQRGIGFGGFVIGAFVLVFASILGLKMIPAYMEEATIKNVFSAITHDPDLQKATLSEIRSSFTKRASIDRISAITAEDLEISSDDGRLFLSATYSVKVPLTGNLSLVMEFNPTSAE